MSLVTHAVINHADLDHVIVVVTRYYGGVKLGTGECALAPRLAEVSSYYVYIFNVHNVHIVNNVHNTTLANNNNNMNI